MNITKTLVLLGVISAASVAMANPIVGSINISGTAVPDNANLASATSIGSIVASDAVVTGNYATAFTTVTVGGQKHLLETPPLITVAYSYSGFNIADGPVSLTPLWTIAQTTIGFGTVNAKFDLLNISSHSVSGSSGAQTLNLFGSGTAYLDGYDATEGNWSFTITSADAGTFTFTAADSSPRNVPDGGATVMLLGTALVGLGALRRKA